MEVFRRDLRIDLTQSSWCIHNVTLGRDDVHADSWTWAHRFECSAWLCLRSSHLIVVQSLILEQESSWTDLDMILRLFVFLNYFSGLICFSSWYWNNLWLNLRRKFRLAHCLSLVQVNFAGLAIFITLFTFVSFRHSRFNLSMHEPFIRLLPRLLICAMYYSNRLDSLVGLISLLHFLFLPEVASLTRH